MHTLLSLGPITGPGSTTMNEIHKREIETELDNCRVNIEFYRQEIENMEEKIRELERLKRDYDYY